MLMARLNAVKNFEKELAQSQIEIKEHTLKNIAWELHDNVGQLLSVANIQLSMLRSKVSEEHYEDLDETKEVVLTTLQEVRSLSKILNQDVILKNGLVGSIDVEMKRFDRLKFVNPTCKIEGNEIRLSNEQEILIFRILQEFFSNVIKHAKAKNLFVHLDYQEHFLHISVRDDGVGFITNQSHKNSGLTTMESRANLLQADFELSSSPGNGTELRLKCPYSYDPR
jgi:signal transduction histidine kinase